MPARRSPAVTDTNPEAADVMPQLLRDAPLWRKLEVVADLNRALRQLVSCELAQRFSENTDEELRVLLASRLYGPEVARAIARAFVVKLD